MPSPAPAKAGVAAWKVLAVVGLLVASGAPVAYFFLSGDAPTTPGLKDQVDDRKDADDKQDPLPDPGDLPGSSEGNSTPPLPLVIPRNFTDTAKSLLEGASARQKGVEPGALDDAKLAILRGRVSTRDGAPLEGVNVTVHQEERFGYTATDGNGTFAMAVNGGTQMTIRYALDGHLTSQRQILAPEKEFAWLPDVVLVPLDPVATVVDFTEPVEVARGSPVTDADGTRQSTLLFAQGTTVEVVLPDGSTQDLESLTVRSTEYTVGDNGPKAMPGELPEESGYTYAMELSVDEAEALGATSVVFSQPVYHYVENFLGFPVGGIAPVGYYDREAAEWVPSENGRIIQILRIENGSAVLDVTGNGSASNATTLAEMGVTAEELETLATLYPAGQSLWRVPIPHFTPWDINWPYGPPDDAEPPTPPQPEEPEEDPCQQGGASIIECHNQVLTETIPLAGTPFHLTYRSDAVPGNTAGYTLKVPISGDTVPASLRRIDVEVTLAGQRITRSLPPAANQTFIHTWDGRDGLGNPVPGAASATVRIGYVYRAVYLEPAEFEQAFGVAGGAPITGSQARQEITLWKDWTGTVGTRDARLQHLGGWSLDVYHQYMEATGHLYTADDSPRQVDPIGRVLRTLAAHLPLPDDGKPATAARFTSLAGIATGPDGSLYLVDEGTDRIRRVATDGTLHTAAGGGRDPLREGPAKEVRLYSPQGVAMALDGTFFFTEGSRVHRVTPDGALTSFKPPSPPSGGSYNRTWYIDNGFGWSEHLAVAPDGTVYIADTYYNVIRRLTPDDQFTRIAGTGDYPPGGYGGPAINATFGTIGGIATGPDGSLYVADRSVDRVLRIAPNGTLTVFAGGGSPSGSGDGDGGPATSARLSNPAGLAVAPDGTVYIADFSDQRVRRVAPDGTIHAFAGTGAYGIAGDGGPALNATFRGPWHLALGPDGTLYVEEGSAAIVRAIGPDGIIRTVAGNTSTSIPYSREPSWYPSLHFTAVALAADGAVYLAGSYADYIFRLGTNETLVPIAGGGTTPVEEGMAARDARLGRVSDLAVAPNGTLYFTDEELHQVWRLAPEGTFHLVAGNGTGGYSGDGGPATQAHLRSPKGIALGGDGSVYVSDTGNGYVRHITPDGIIRSIAGLDWGNYTETQNLSRPPALRTMLFSPRGLDVDAHGNVYLATQLHNAIFRITPDGNLTTVVGGEQDDSLLSLPSDVTLAEDGSLYVTDTYHSRVVRVTPDGTLTTVAGTGRFPWEDPNWWWGGSRVDGLATEVNLTLPEAVAVGSDGSVHILDSGRIRRVALALPGHPDVASAVPNRDGSELYGFDVHGRHLVTLDTLTGATRYRFEHDAAGRLVSIRDGHDLLTRIERNATGVPTAVVGPYGHRTALLVGPGGYLTAATDPVNATTRMTYGATGLLTSFTQPTGAVSRFAYDSAGRLTRDVDPTGAALTLTRTELPKGYEVTLAASSGRHVRYAVERTPEGMRYTTTDATGGRIVTLKGHDGSIHVTHPDGTVIAGKQVPDPRWGDRAPFLANVTLTTPGGLTTTVLTERLVTLQRVGQPLSVATFVERLTDAGRTTTTAYDAATRTLTVTTPEGRVTTTWLDEHGDPVRHTEPGSAPLALSYDAHGRLNLTVEGSAAGARTTRLQYDAQGNLASVTDPLGATTQYSYDAAGRLTRTTRPDGSIVQAAYDARGALVSLTTPSGGIHAFAHSPVGRLVSYAPPGGVAAGVTYTYDANREVTGITRGGATVTYAYDAAGRLLQASETRGTTTYTYAAARQEPVGILAPGGVSLALAYDGFLPTSETWSGPVSGTVARQYGSDLAVASWNVAGVPFALTRDRDGLVVTAGDLALSRNGTSGLVTGAALGALTVTREYDEDGLLTQEETRLGDTVLHALALTRDALGRVTERAETTAGVTTTRTFAYDVMGRLVSESVNGTAVATYAYDTNGNRVSGPAGAATYDTQDRLLTQGSATYAYAASGDLATKTQGASVTRYIHTATGTLEGVTLPEGRAVTYLLDGLHRRVGKAVDGSLVQGFLYGDGDAIVAELDGAGNVVSRFVYGTSPDTPDYLVKEGRTYLLVKDAVGSVLLVVDAESGAIAQRLQYDAFGRVLVDTNPGFQPFAFAGGHYDPDTGLVHFGARDYDAETGRWLTRDPILFDGGQVNLYAYVGNDPVNYVDPDGLDGHWGGKALQKFQKEAGQGEYERLQKDQKKNAKEAEKQGNIVKRIWNACVNALAGEDGSAPGPNDGPRQGPPQLQSFPNQ